METKQQTEKPELFHLWWIDQDKKTRVPAGVAFYEPNYGEYRLKIDFIQSLAETQNQKFYVKPVSTDGDRISFRVEAAVSKGGKFMKRCPIGEGYSSKETEGAIYMNFGPFEKSLVLTY